MKPYLWVSDGVDLHVSMSNAPLQKVLSLLSFDPEGHTEWYQLDVSITYSSVSTEQQYIHLNICRDAQPASTTIYKSLLAAVLPQLMRVSRRTSHSHQSADVGFVPSGSRNLCDARHVYDKWSSCALVHKHYSPRISVIMLTWQQRSALRIIDFACCRDVPFLLKGWLSVRLLHQQSLEPSHRLTFLKHFTS